MRSIIHAWPALAVALITSCVSDFDSRRAEPPLVPECASHPPSHQRKGSWISRPTEYPGDINTPPISKKTYWQTQMTTLPMAIERLETKTIVGLTEEDAEYYAGPHYEKTPGTRPYLVRAVFWNYTGDFELFWRDGELYVSHGSLGHIDGEEKMPLVINLKHAPKRVYTYLGAIQ